MARLTIPDEDRRIEDAEEIRAFLKPFGIWYEQWSSEGRAKPDASNEEILSAYEPEIERLKKRGGYVTADVINVTAETPGLQKMLDTFNKEHTHRDDEVRFIVKGRGIFHIHAEATGGREKVFGIQTEAGDLINLPAGTKHWFDLCEERAIRAIRLFVDPTGWTPEYVESGVHGKYPPVCWGPAYIPPS